MSDVVLQFDRVSKRFRRGQLHDSLRDYVPYVVKSFLRRGAARELSKQEFWALHDVSFTIRKGEAVGIIGPNGAGKSTILKILTGIMNPTEGQKLVNGSLSALIEVGAGFHPDLTGRENIFLNGTILGMSRRQIRSKLDEIIEFSGLSEFIDTPVKRYSSGMYARLGFSIACHVDPDILIVDEVLSVGDWAFQNKSMEKMRSILHGGATVIFVSHNLKAVTGLCSRAIYLERGEIQAEGPSASIVETYIQRATARAQGASPVDKAAFIESVRLRGRNGEGTLFHPGDLAFVDVTIGVERFEQPLAVAIALRDEGYNMFFYVDSARLRTEALRLTAGERRTLTFELQMHVAPGSYFLNVALTQPDLDQLLDHRGPACSFLVQSDIDVRGVAQLYPRLLSS